MKKFIQSLKLGAKGYMLKTSSAAEILNSIRKVYRGEEAIETEVDNKIKYHDSHPDLHDDLTGRVNVISWPFWLRVRQIKLLLMSYLFH